MLSYCAEQAVGLTAIYRDSQHNEKAYVVGGMSAHNGIAAAQMVASGFTGVEDVLSGESNFLSGVADAHHRERAFRAVDLEPVGGRLKGLELCAGELIEPLLIHFAGRADHRRRRTHTAARFPQAPGKQLRGAPQSGQIRRGREGERHDAAYRRQTVILYKCDVLSSRGDIKNA